MTDIFSLADDSPASKVSIDGKDFFVKVLSALDRDAFETQWLGYKEADSVIGIRPFMVAFCLCNSQGDRQFESGKKSKPSSEFCEAVVRIGNLPAGKVQPLFSEAMTVNGFSDAEVDELEKK
jgi:ribosome biogenesis protein Nip4